MLVKGAPGGHVLRVWKLLWLVGPVPLNTNWFCMALAPSTVELQTYGWEMSFRYNIYTCMEKLQSNAVSHWLGAYLESALYGSQENKARCEQHEKKYCPVFIFKFHRNCFIPGNPSMKKLTLPYWFRQSGISLAMRPANERRRHNVTTSLIGWVHI